MNRHVRYYGIVAILKYGNKKQKLLCNTSIPNCGFAHTYTHTPLPTHILTTPKKPARSTASFLARLKTWSVFCVYVLTSDGSLPKALTVRMLLIRSSANYTHSFIMTMYWKSDDHHSKFNKVPQAVQHLFQISAKLRDSRDYMALLPTNMN